MNITRLNTARGPHASGFMPPLVRLATHLGYVAAMADKLPETDWTETRGEIFRDLEEAKGHIEEVITDPSPFLGQNAIDLMASFKVSFEAFLEDGTGDNRNTVLTNLQNLAHNLGFLAASYESDAIGHDSSEGSAL